MISFLVILKPDRDSQFSTCCLLKHWHFAGGQMRRVVAWVVAALLVSAVGLSFSYLKWELVRALEKVRYYDEQAVRGRKLHHAVSTAVDAGEAILHFTDQQKRSCLLIPSKAEKRRLIVCVAAYEMESETALYLPDFK
jgi:hypothetical protein